jgi:hypothetical protein
MAPPEELQIETPAVPVEHRAKVRSGFGLCFAGLAMAMFGAIGIHFAPFFFASLGPEWLESHVMQFKFAARVWAVVVQCVLVAGWVLLYLVPHGQRWRQAATCLLAMGGIDLVMLSLQIFSDDPIRIAVADVIGMTLGWVELWMIAVLGAEAAESAGRSDITYQTEVAGKLIVWSGFVWLAELIWTFDPNKWPWPDEINTESFGYLLGIVAVLLYLFVLIRTVMFCGGLASEYASTGDTSEPGASA